MGAVLVTVIGPGSRIDLALPDDAPIDDLIPTLVRRCEPDPQPWSRWALGPLGGEPFPPRRTLTALNVVDGAELELRDMIAPDTTAPHARPATQGREAGTTVSGGDTEPDARRQRITTLAERLVDDIIRIQAGKNPLLEYAAPEARRRLRALAPGTFDRAGDGEFSNLSLAVSWHRDPRAPVEALASFIEIAGCSAGGDLTGPGHSWPEPTPAALPARRVGVRMTVDSHCRYLLDINVAAEPPFI
jgi:hypothetical protein